MEFKQLIIPETEKKEIAQVLACNDKTYQYCLSLKEEEVRALIAARRENFRELELLEFNEGILPRLIEVFADSPYLFQDSYADTLGSLQYLFYRFKRGSDEDMLELMKNAYDNICQGSLELLVQYFEGLEWEDRKHGRRSRDSLDPVKDYVDYTDGLYDFGELLPVLMKVSRICTEDTSLSYNEARGLMTAVTYCIREGIRGQKNSIAAALKPDAMLMYKEGRAGLMSRMKEIKGRTKELFGLFCDYGSSFVRRTVFEDVQTIIARMDLFLAPHELPAALDYPVVCDLSRFEGVEKLQYYVDGLVMEWRFMADFPVSQVMELLKKASGGRPEDFCENVSVMVLLQALGCIIAEKPVKELCLDLPDIDTIRIYFMGDDKEQVEKELWKLCGGMLDEEGREYFGPAIRDIAVRIHNAGEKNFAI